MSQIRQCLAHQYLTFCLWNKKDDEYEGAEHHRCEEEVDSAAVLAHCQKHLNAHQSARCLEIPHTVRHGMSSDRERLT